MPKKTPKRYMRIVKYLEKKHGDLYDAVDDLGVYGLFTPRKGSGVTFLLPKGKALKKLIDSAYSDKPEDAQMMLKAHVLTLALKSPADFEKYKSDIPNLLGQRLEVKAVSAKGVELKNGAKLVLDSSFKAADSRSNMAVWVIDGEVPLDGPKSTGKFANAAPKKGGFNESGGEADAARVAVARNVEEKYRAFLRTPCSARRSNPYVCAVVSLLSQVDADTRARVAPMVYPCAETTFYSLYEPYKLSEGGSDYLIPMADKLDLDLELAGARDSYRALFKSGLGNSAATAEAARIVGEASGSEMFKAMVKVYRQLEESNSVGSVSDVFPEATAMTYAANEGLKRFQDDFNFRFSRKFCSLKDELSGEAAANGLAQVLMDVRAATGSGYNKDYFVTDGNMFRHTTREVYEGVSDGFVNGGYLMHVVKPVEQYRMEAKIGAAEDSDDDEWIGAGDGCACGSDEFAHLDALNDTVSVGGLESAIRTLSAEKRAELLSKF